MTITETGLYPNIPDAEYHALRLCSNSQLTKIFDRSPLHCRYAAEHPEEKECLEIGKALHLAILQPEKFAEQFARRPDGLDLRRKEDKAQFEEFKAANADRSILACDAYDSISRMASAVYANLDARVLLD